MALNTSPEYDIFEQLQKDVLEHTRRAYARCGSTVAKAYITDMYESVLDCIADAKKEYERRMTKYIKHFGINYIRGANNVRKQG